MNWINRQKKQQQQQKIKIIELSSIRIVNGISSYLLHKSKAVTQARHVYYTYICSNAGNP